MAATTAHAGHHASEAVPWQYQPALDGLRTLAVYVVVAFHGGLGLFAGGFIGVDLFFVLSGFLVTSVLLDGLARHGQLRLLRFYARRVRRLLPAAAACLIATSVAYVLVVPSAARQEALGGARAAFLYVANWHFLGRLTDYFGAEQDASPFLHFWSLAVEEQFYLVFPVLLLGSLAVARRSARPPLALTVILGSAMLLSVARQVSLARTDELHAYYATDARLYQLLAGATLAAALCHQPQVRSRWPAPGATAVVGVAGFVLVASSAWSASASARGLVATVVSVAVVGSLAVDRDSPAAWVLSRRPMTYLGQISYGTYLWHWPIVVLAGEVVDISPKVMTALAVVGATGLASLSFHLLEHPIRSAAWLAPRQRGVVAVGLAVSVAGGLVLAPAILSSGRPTSVTPVAAGATAAGGALADAELPPDLPWAAARDDTPEVPDCRGRPAAECVVVRGEGAHLHLVGDSHARTMLPLFEQMARAEGITFSASVAPSCPWQRDLHYETTEDKLAACREHQADWYDRVIPELSPDVVVLVHRAFVDPAAPTPMTSDDPELAGLDQPELIRASAERSIGALVDGGSRVVLVEPLPVGPFDTAVCLSGARRLGECAFEAPREPSTTEVVYRYTAQRSRRVWSLDLDDVVCPDLPWCAPVVDGLVVRRDRHHLTGTFAASRAGEVRTRLLEAGVLGGGSS